MSIKIKYITLIILVLVVVNIKSQVVVGSSNNFISVWNTESSTTITLPIHFGSNYDLYWEEVGNASNNGTMLGQTGAATITALTANTDYRIEAFGTMSRIYNFNQPNSEHTKPREVVQWGSNSWTSLQLAFYNANLLEVTATDTPNLSSCTSLSQMF